MNRTSSAMQTCTLQLIILATHHRMLKSTLGGALRPIGIHRLPLNERGGLRPPSHMVVAAFGRHHHVGNLIDWQPVLISICHGLLISTCRGLLISTDGLINHSALIIQCRVLFSEPDLFKFWSIPLDCFCLTRNKAQEQT